jgi:hypothetical protein
MATLNNQGNTIKKVSLGVTWRQLGITEVRPQAAGRMPHAAACLLACPSPQANPIKVVLSSQLLVPGTRNEEPGTGEVRLAMYDLAGREVVALNGLRLSGVPVVVRIPKTIAPGTYFLVAESDGEWPQQKLVVVR